MLRFQSSSKARFWYPLPSLTISTSDSSFQVHYMYLARGNPSDRMMEFSTEILTLYWSLSVNEITFSFLNFLTWSVFLNHVIHRCLLKVKFSIFFFCTASQMGWITCNKSYLKPFVWSSSRTCLWWFKSDSLSRRPEKEGCLSVISSIHQCF